MKQPERTIAVVQIQIDCAKRNKQPRVLAKLEKELAQMEANRPAKLVTTPAKRINMNVYDNRAAFAFYNK